MNIITYSVNPNINRNNHRRWTMANKMATLKWVTVMVALSFVVCACSDDNTNPPCLGDQCQQDSGPLDQGPQKDGTVTPDGKVKPDGIMPDGTTKPDTGLNPSGNCPANGIAFDCVEDGTKKPAERWVSDGEDNTVNGTCGLVRDYDKLKSWFGYNKITKIATEVNLKITCNLAK